jgi:ribosomal protein S18 acetylase RimI-like enzyme
MSNVSRHMKTRALAAADASAVAELWLVGAQESAAVDSAFLPRVSVSEYSASLTEELLSGAVVGWGCYSVEGSLMGYLTARLSEASAEFVPSKYLYLLDLDVRSSARRQGVASELVRAARRFSLESGVGSLEVSWLLADARATAFWHKQGFIQYLARARSAVEVEAPQ